MTRPLMLDLFCCEGGAGKGYNDAGFEVIGVDSKPQPLYPYEFHQADALEFAAVNWRDFAAIHASPPCQGYTVATLGVPEIRAKHPRLIEPVRELLSSTGLPYVIENVVGAPMVSPMILCGSMFGITAVDDDGTVLRLERHRLFESNIFLIPPGLCRHDERVPVGGVYGGGRSDRREAKEIRRGGYTPSKRVRSELIGADWMTLHGLSQSIPPAYTEFIGRQLIAAMEAAS